MITNEEVKEFIRRKIERNLTSIDMFGDKHTYEWVRATEGENEYYNYLMDLLGKSEDLHCDLNGYQSCAMRTANKLSRQQLIHNGVLGLNGESGELADLLKKNLFQGHELNNQKMVEELGDVLWYVAILAKGLGVSLSEVARQNVEKLKKRYPQGFDAKRSINRSE